MYYKVLKNNKVIDVLDNLIYLKWEPKHKIMVLTDENQAQAILSSDKNTIWHEITLYNVPVDEPKFETVELVEIDSFEYRQLKALNGKSPEQIADEVILSLIESGII
jgi:hypothetical protein